MGWGREGGGGTCFPLKTPSSYSYVYMMAFDITGSILLVMGSLPPGTSSTKMSVLILAH